MRVIKKGVSFAFYIFAVVLVITSIYILFVSNSFTEWQGLMFYGLSLLSLIIGTMFMSSYLFVRRDRMKTIRITFKILLCMYILFIVYVAFYSEDFGCQNFSLACSGGEISKRFTYSSNIIPLHTIRENISQCDGLLSKASLNLYGYVLSFIPLGFLLPAVFKAMRKTSVFVIVSLLMVVLIEFVQLVTGCGRFDVDDIILAFAGLIIGWIVSMIPPIKSNIEKTKFRRY